MLENHEVYVFAIRTETGEYVPQVAVEAESRERAIQAYGAFGASSEAHRQPFGAPLHIQITYVPVIRA